MKKVQNLRVYRISKARTFSNFNFEWKINSEMLSKLQSTCMRKVYHSISNIWSAFKRANRVKLIFVLCGIHLKHVEQIPPVCVCIFNDELLYANENRWGNHTTWRVTKTFELTDSSANLCMWFWNAICWWKSLDLHLNVEFLIKSSKYAEIFVKMLQKISHWMLQCFLNTHGENWN